MIKVGIIGCGTIGQELARACATRFKDKVALTALCDIDESKVRGLKKTLTKNRVAILSADELIARCDLVIESASKQAAYGIARRALESGKDVMLMSSGGILGHEKEIFALARLHRCCLYIPSGAVCGIDGLKAAQMGQIRRVTLTTRKPPASFENTPYVMKRKINLKDLKQEVVLFQGNALEAIKHFPKNINVSATLSLAGLGPRKTQVRIIASPEINVHIHEVYMEGECGKIYTRVDNVPSRNPKTSRLAVLSAIGTLDRILGNVKIGT